MKLLCTIALGLSLLAAPAHAEKFVVGVEDTQMYPIFGFKGGRYSGYARDLLDAFGKKHGYTFVFNGRHVDRLYKEFLAEDSRLDFKFPDSDSWRAAAKNNRNITYSNPVYDGYEVSLVRPHRVGLPITDIKRLGTIRGFELRPYREELASGATRAVYSSSLIGLIQDAKDGRVDAILVHEEVAMYFLKNVMRTPEALVPDRSLPSNDVSYRLSSVKHPSVIAEFNEFLALEYELVDQLKAKYQLTDIRTPK